MNDDELERLAQQLGARAAERLDVERAAQAVLTQLREEPQRTRGVWLGVTAAAWLKLAAAIVIVVGAGLVVRGRTSPVLPGSALVEPAGGELNGLSAEQLRELLHTVEQPGEAPEAVSAQDVGLDDLSTPQLRVLLQSLEG